MLHRDRTKSFTAKEAMLNLWRIEDQLEPLLNDPEYTKLIQYILEYEGLEVPVLKTVAEKTGLRTHILAKKLKDLYFLVLEKEDFLKFERAEYNLYYKFHKNFYHLRLDFLPVVPRVGDTFESYFLEGILGTGSFTVKKILHDLDKGKQIINIHLGEYLSQKD